MQSKFNLDLGLDPVRLRESSNFRLNFNAEQLIFCNYYNYQCLHDFLKFDCKRITNTEIFSKNSKYALILKPLPVCNTKYRKHHILNNSFWSVV